MGRRLSSRPPLELWAGVECTVNRVGDRFFDQLERSGHALRIEDLDLFAELGVRAMRYPVLWERTAPDGLDRADWSWADERLGRLRQLGIRPIAGLLHHGSGPRDTSLVDPAFPERLAGYARAVAERYPWVEDYTPVNEPLTTARFSGLYGHWYPHGRDGLVFARALLGQCRGVVLAMRAIREVNPAARLIQTEDVGKTYSTPALAYQAEFENDRRWLSYDLLCGRVDRGHPLWGYLRWLGVEEHELELFLAEPCPPDIVGLNHYLTGERFLDERLDRYPQWTHGGNGRQAYADVEAVRVLAEGIAGPRGAMAETWGRYHLPIAITEAHLGCTREEQLRWLTEVWEAAHSLRRSGADIRAVAAWSLLGAYDWDSLVTCSAGHYEPGVFDLRGPRPRPTALAKLLRELARGRRYTHPVISAPGWWRRAERLLYPPVSGHASTSPPSRPHAPRTRARRCRPLAITGANGALGNAFARLCEVRGIPFHQLTHEDMDIADPASVRAVLRDIDPWAVVNAAGYVHVDTAEREPEACRRSNVEGPTVLAEACAEQHSALVTFSSHLVFDGTQRSPYVERDAPAPLCVYGRSKAEAEVRVLEAMPSALVVRTGTFFGPWDQQNFLAAALRALAVGHPFAAANDAVISPAYLPDLVNASLDLLIDGEAGVWHLANDGALTWEEFARHAAALAGFPPAKIEACTWSDLGYIAPRPEYSVLGSVHGALLPDLQDALSRYARERPSAV